MRGNPGCVPGPVKGGAPHASHRTAREPLREGKDKGRAGFLAGYRLSCRTSSQIPDIRHAGHCICYPEMFFKKMVK